MAIRHPKMKRLNSAGRFMKRQFFFVAFVLSGSLLMAQSVPSAPADSPAPAGSASAGSSAATSSASNKGKGPDRAAAYYHFTLAHMYEEQVATYGRSDLANKAIEEYRAAIDADPTSSELSPPRGRV